MTQQKKNQIKVFFRFVSKNPLFVMLLILQLISTLTTIEGAEIIFSSTNITIPFFAKEVPTHVVLGITCQLLLFILLTFPIIQKFPIRKWIAIIILTIVSTYSSCYSFYNSITSNSIDKQGSFNKQARDTHKELKRLIYEPLRLERADLEGKVALKVKEQNKFSQDSERYQFLNDEIYYLNTRIQELANYLDNVKNWFEKGNDNQDFKKMLPAEIYDRDMESIARLGKIDYQTNNARNKYIQEFKIQKDNFKREKYFEEKAFFLIPYELIFINKERNAIFALIIAGTIDGLTLMLGSTRQSFTLFKNIAGFYDSIIVGKKRLWTSIIESNNQVVEPFFSNNESPSLAKSTNILNSKHERYRFLVAFYNSIDMFTYQVDFKKLINSQEYVEINQKAHKNIQSRQIAYRILLDALVTSPLEWLELKKSRGFIEKIGRVVEENLLPSRDTKPEEITEELKIYVKKDKYKTLVKWLSSEIEKYKQDVEIDNNISGGFEFNFEKEIDLDSNHRNSG